MAKQFISFLGTNNYLPCVYFWQEKSNGVGPVTFVQTATVKLLCNDFKDNDRITIFITEQAESKHKEALIQEFEKFGIKQPEFVKIPDGKSEKELWEIFDIVFNSLEQKGEIIFDITHSFRYLPMLSIVLLNYASFVKEIEIAGIYYGAFEVLGSSQEIKEKYPDGESRFVPIFDLTPLAYIQKWTAATQSFVVSGNAELLAKMIKQSRGIFFRNKNGNDENLKQIFDRINPLINSLQKFSNEILTCRGERVYSGETIEELKENIENIKQNKERVSANILPFLNLVGKMEQKIDEFKPEKAFENIIQSAKFSLEHGYIQQSITQFQEGIITYLCEKHKEEITKYFSDKFENGMKKVFANNIGNFLADQLENEIKSKVQGLFEEKDFANYRKKFLREFVASLLNVIGQKISEENWYSILTDDIKLAHKLQDDEQLIDLAKQVFTPLTQLRNDINHGGYLENAFRYDIFHKRLTDLFNKFEDILTNTK